MKMFLFTKKNVKHLPLFNMFIFYLTFLNCELYHDKCIHFVCFSHPLMLKYEIETLLFFCQLYIKLVDYFSYIFLCSNLF